MDERHARMLAMIAERVDIAPMVTTTGLKIDAVSRVKLDDGASGIEAALFSAPGADALRFVYDDGSHIDVLCELGDHGASLIYDGADDTPLGFAALTSDGLCDLNAMAREDGFEIGFLLSVHTITDEALSNLIKDAAPIDGPNTERWARLERDGSLRREYEAFPSVDQDELRPGERRRHVSRANSGHVRPTLADAISAMAL